MECAQSLKETLSAQLEEEEEEEEDVSPEQDTIRVIQQHLQGRAEWVEDRAKQLRFLHAVPRLCFSAQQQGWDTLEPHFSKAALVESIAELIENLPMASEPSSIVSSSMAAVCSLSKLKPPLALELESRLLRALLYTIFTMGTGQDTTHFQALHNTYLESLDSMLGGLLAETPTTDKLQHLLEHLHFWLDSRNTQERARAIRSSAALLRFATSLSGFDTSSDFPKAGNFVLQLGLCISDPADDISRQARDGIYWLQRLLLQRRGLNIREESDLWCRDGLQDTERLAYRNMARVGEVFGEIFTEGQKRSFLQAALLAIHDPEIRVSQAGLVLTYSILGEAGQLIGNEQEDVTATIMAHLFYIRCLRQVPKALQGLCSVGQP
ncbi:maestro heat-like repeat family member 5 [Chelonia mydas]|nr:maestro heat-like repeat family member 5 [Chelonia mydas]XP_043393623.1 maestro heat-like repeat family member 5 [Chelonia mydas]XP_043393624.1 maestro heat-like repeat family member 5 [Chelonia mydas]XP_043393626.1 maestro heat-like repeat family member 5 [Chelonia mydas]XP_043393627.1 maestro heat-like repeat family member 5 [Chelonia mydas]